MPLFFKRFTLCFLLILPVLIAFGQPNPPVALTLTPLGTMPYTAGSPFQVAANYSYSNVSGNIVITINYNPAFVTFCNSTSFPYIPTDVPVNATTRKITYTFPTNAVNNESSTILMCFTAVCPQTCFGQNTSTSISGNIDAPTGGYTAAATPANIITTVLNNWTGSHYWYSFVQSSMEITFKANLSNGTCFQINSPVFEVTPSIGTLVSAIGGTISGNTITPTATTFSPGSSYHLTYTIRLPCNTEGGTPMTSNLVLKGMNCGTGGTVIRTYPQVSFTIPVNIPSNPAATVDVFANPGSYSVKIKNTGNTPLNLTSFNTIPPVKTTSVSHSASSTVAASAMLTWYNCAGVASTPVSLPAGTTNTTPPTYATEATINISNLMPNETSTFTFFYNLSNSCSGIPNLSSYSLISRLTYNCNTSNLNPVCYGCPAGTPGGNAADTAIYNLKPELACNGQPTITNCFRPGDTINLCVQFHNINGTADLLNGKLTYNLPGFLTYLPGAGNDTYTNFPAGQPPVYVSGSSIKWDLPTLPDSNVVYKICFKVRVNSNAPYGSYGPDFSITGTNYSQSFNCKNRFQICALPQVQVEKLVKGSEDVSFGTTGSGLPGSTATYQVTIRNTGNTTLGNVSLIDRLPFPGDKTIISCADRNSRFTMFPASAISIPGAVVTYSATPNVSTTWPTAATSCAGAGTFGATFQPNNLKIALGSNIPPGGIVTFTFPVVVSAGARKDSSACNTIGLICDLIDNLNNATQMNPIESNPICLRVKESPPPPVPGCCKEVIKNIVLQQEVVKNTINATVNISAGPVKMKKVSLSIVDFRVSHPKECESCVKDPTRMGNITKPSGNVNFNYVPAGLPFSRHVEWKADTGMNWSTGMPVKFEIPLPAKNPNSCCCDTIEYCIKYSFTDINCITCDTIICYKTYNGKECPPVVTTACNCSFAPVYTYSGAAGLTNKAIPCGEYILLPRNITSKFNPNFNCSPASASCAPTGVSVTVLRPNGTSQVLTAPDYSFTYTATGLYTYVTSGSCGGKLCSCKTFVKVQ